MTNYDALMTEAWKKRREYVVPSTQPTAPNTPPATPSTFASRLLTPSQILTMPEPDWLIDGWIPTSTLMMTYGAPGSYKSFVALDQAIHIANGLDWQGQPTQAGLCLYIVAEDVQGQQYRQRAWSEHHGAVVSEENMRYYPAALNLLDKNAVADAVRWVKTAKPVYIVVDTLHRSTPGANENDSKEMGAAIDACCRMRDASDGGSVNFLHHTDKSGERYRGSSALEGDTDVIVKLTKSGLSVVLAQEKMKNGEPLKMSLDLDLIDLGKDSKGRAIDSLVVTASRDVLSYPKRHLNQKATMLEAVADHPGWSSRAIIGTTDIPERSGLRLLAELEKSGSVRHEDGARKAKLWHPVD
jgi:hypothetical protein